MTTHQQHQLQVIAKIDEQVSNQSLNFTTVSPVTDFESDTRMCLTSVHFPDVHLKTFAQEIISQLQSIEPDNYYYDNDSLHMTIKNVKVINDPPQFDAQDVTKVEQVFSKIVPQHKKFNVYFYRLLLLPNNVSLIGTTDPELDTIIFDLDEGLNNVGVPDDKKYTNDKHFFSNMTLARFDGASKKFSSKVAKISEQMSVHPYQVTDVSLVQCNAVFKKLQIINTWGLI